MYSLLRHVRLFVTPWTVACQAPLSMGFSRQEYWSGLPCPPPGDLPNPGIKPGYPALPAGSLLSEPPGKAANEGNEVQRDAAPCSGHLASLGLNFLNHLPVREWSVLTETVRLTLCMVHTKTP